MWLAVAFRSRWFSQAPPSPPHDPPIYKADSGGSWTFSFVRLEELLILLNNDNDAPTTVKDWVSWDGMI